MGPIWRWPSRPRRNPASASQDHTLQLWDVERATLRSVLQGHTHVVWSLASPDGKGERQSGPHGAVVGCQSAETPARAYDEAPRWRLRPMGKSSPASEDGTVRLWSADSGTPESTLYGHADRVTSVAYAPDGEFSPAPVSTARSCCGICRRTIPRLSQRQLDSTQGHYRRRRRCWPTFPTPSARRLHPLSAPRLRPGSPGHLRYPRWCSTWAIARRVLTSTSAARWDDHRESTACICRLQAGRKMSSLIGDRLCVQGGVRDLDSSQASGPLRRLLSHTRGGHGSVWAGETMRQRERGMDRERIERVARVYATNEAAGDPRHPSAKLQPTVPPVRHRDALCPPLAAAKGMTCPGNCLSIGESLQPGPGCL